LTGVGSVRLCSEHKRVCSDWRLKTLSPYAPNHPQSFLQPPTHRRSKYEVIMVSPRNYFLYTPLLPAVATGTMEERSIVEPVRNLVQKKVRGG